LKGFTNTVRECIDAELAARGFAHRLLAYRRTTEAGIVHGICFDNRGRNLATFRLMLFANAPAIDGDADGGHFVRYFTGGSLSSVPRELPCKTEDQLRATLERFRAHLDSMIEPLFSSVAAPAALAAALADDPLLEAYRARLHDIGK
jgi:hypothetical protein